MELFSLMLQDLYSHCIGNKIYCFDGTETKYYEKAKKYVYKRVEESEKYNGLYIDIVLDFSDYSKVKPLFDENDGEIDNYEKRKARINKIYDYLKYSILAKLKNVINIDDDSDFFDSSLRDLYNGEPIWNTFPDNLFFEGVGSVVNAVNRYLRIHIFLDEVDDVDLKVAINSFLVENQFAFMCYTAKELATYMSIKGESISSSGSVTVAQSRVGENNAKKRIKERFVVIEEELK